MDALYDTTASTDYTVTFTVSDASGDSTDSTCGNYDPWDDSSPRYLQRMRVLRRRAYGRSGETRVEVFGDRVLSRHEPAPPLAWVPPPTPPPLPHELHWPETKPRVRPPSVHPPPVQARNVAVRGPRLRCHRIRRWMSPLQQMRARRQSG